MLGQWGEFFLKVAVIFAGIYLIIILTPKLAAFIDRRRVSKPRPERVDDDENNPDKPDEADGENNSQPPKS